MKISKKTNKLLYLVICANFSLATVNAKENNQKRTQDSTDISKTTVLDTVTVTARHRDEDIKNVPFSVSKITHDNTDGAGANDGIGDLAREIANLTLTEAGGTYSNTFLLRGVGSLQPMASDDSAVAVYEAGVPKSIASAPVNLFDIERVEVMRGPQGTLFGRNSQGGAIQVIPNLPEFEDAFTIGTSFGNLNQRMGYFIANKAFSENIAGRLAVRHSGHNGTIDNLVTGDKNGKKRDDSARAALRFFTGDSTEINISAWMHHKDSDSPRAILRDNLRFPQVAIAPNNTVKWRDAGARAEISHDWRGMRLTSLTSFEDSRATQNMDFTDGLIFAAITSAPASVFNKPYGDFSAMNHDEKRWQQEFRLTSLEDNSLQWQIGTNIFYSEFENDTLSQAKTRRFAWLNGRQNNYIKTLSTSLFGEMDVPFNEIFRANVGARLTHERKDADYQFVGNGHPAVVKNYTYQSKKSDTLLSGRIGLSAKASPQVTLYGNIAHGTTAGGYPLFAMTLANGKPVEDYPKSHSWTYETGAKWRSFDEKTSLNASFFYNDVNDGHLVVFNRAEGNLNTVVKNYRSFGLELDGYWQISSEWSLNGHLGYTKASLQNVSYNDRTGAKNGSRLANVPTISASAGLHYQQEKGLFGNLTWQYVGKRTADLANHFDLNPYSLVNAKIGFAKDNWKVYAFGRNITDEQTEIAGQSWGNGVQSVRLGEPRLFGIGFEAQW